MGDAEMLEHPGRHVDDPGRRRSEPDRDHRNLRVALLEGAVAPAARVMAASEVRELEPRSGGDDEVAGIRVAESGPGALERVRLREDVLGAVRVPALGGRREAQLLAVAARD